MAKRKSSASTKKERKDCDHSRTREDTFTQYRNKQPVSETTVVYCRDCGEELSRTTTKL